jgi:hypothetical protein
MTVLIADIPEDNGAGGKKRSSSPLRKRMIEDMELAGLAPTTQQTYLSSVATLQKTLQRRPDRLTEEEVRRYLIWLREEKGVARGTFQAYFYGLKFFYNCTLGVDWSLFSKRESACPIRSGFLTPFHVRIAAA